MAKGKVLVVDDEIYIVHILDFSLGMEGYEVITALDGEQALAKAATEKPDIIVLDSLMPRVDGYETLKQLKNNPATKDIPVVMISARNRGEDIRLADKHGAEESIAKPFSPRKLVERINIILASRRSK